MDERTHRRGPLHSVWQPDVQWYLRRFPHCSSEQEQGNRRQHPSADVDLTELLLEAEQVCRFEGHKEEQDAQHEPKVTDPIDNEGFVASVRGTLTGVPEADEQIRTQPHPFPADEHE